MEKLNSLILNSITQLRSNEKQPNESTIMNLLSEKLGELSIDKEQVTESLKRFVEYKNLH